MMEFIETNPPDSHRRLSKYRIEAMPSCISISFTANGEFNKLATAWSNVKTVSVIHGNIIYISAFDDSLDRTMGIVADDPVGVMSWILDAWNRFGAGLPCSDEGAA